MKEIKITHCKYDLKFDYYVRDNGTIYSSKSHKILSPQLDKNGYEKVQMMSNDGKRHRYSVHRLVLENFNPIENMDKLQVNHIDGNKRNNKLNNLEWVTCQENIQHAILNNLRAKQYGVYNPQSKLSEDQVKEIIKLLLTHKYTYNQIIKQLNLDINEDAIGQIKRKERWCYLTQNVDFN